MQPPSYAASKKGGGPQVFIACGSHGVLRQRFTALRRPCKKIPGGVVRCLRALARKLGRIDEEGVITGLQRESEEDPFGGGTPSKVCRVPQSGRF